MKKLPPLILAAVIAVITCSDNTPTESPGLTARDTIRDTLLDTIVDTVFLTITDTITTLDSLFVTDTLYLQDTVDYHAVDLMTVGFDLARRVLMDSTTNGSIKFVDVGYCDSPTQVHASLGCEFFKVYGKIYTKQGGNIPDGLKRFTAWLRYDGDGPTSDTANWDLFDMEWR